uniref:Uncharacterized protein n=1 Tax=Anguilla anguilla TaxID=7936 RepID=A0A0E9XGW9_ANGAN
MAKLCSVRMPVDHKVHSHLVKWSHLILRREASIVKCPSLRCLINLEVSELAQVTLIWHYNYFSKFYIF